MKTHEINEIKERLQSLLNLSNGVVYTGLDHVSSSGMTRHISCYLATQNEGEKPRITDITYFVSQITGYKRNSKNGGLVISGCGMDMGFHVVYGLSCRMYCPDKYNHDAAYKLKHKWL